METRHDVTSKQLFTFIASAQIGIGLLSLPATMARKSGHDGWIPILIAGMICTAIFCGLVLCLKRFEKKSIYDINFLLYGKYVGSLLNGIVIAYLAFAAVLGIRLFVEVVRSMALKGTPQLLMTLFVMLPTIYLTIYGFKSICRFTSMILVIVLGVYGFLLLNINRMHPSFLMPVGETGVSGILSGMPDAFFAFVGFELVVIFYPYIMDVEYVLKWGIAANLFSTIFFCIVITCTTAFFGAEMLLHLELPFFQLSGCYKSQIFERVDLFYTMLWFPAMGMSIRTYFFAGYDSICRLFQIKKPAWIIAAYSTFVILASRLPKNLAHTEALMNLISLFAVIMIALVFFNQLLSLILKRKG